MRQRAFAHMKEFGGRGRGRGMMRNGGRGGSRGAAAAAARNKIGRPATGPAAAQSDGGAASYLAALVAPGFPAIASSAVARPPLVTMSSEASIPRAVSDSEEETALGYAAQDAVTRAAIAAARAARDPADPRAAHAAAGAAVALAAAHDTTAKQGRLLVHSLLRRAKRRFLNASAEATLPDSAVGGCGSECNGVCARHGPGAMTCAAALDARLALSPGLIEIMTPSLPGQVVIPPLGAHYRKVWAEQALTADVVAAASRLNVAPGPASAAVGGGASSGRRASSNASSVGAGTGHGAGGDGGVNPEVSAGLESVRAAAATVASLVGGRHEPAAVAAGVFGSLLGLSSTNLTAALDARLARENVSGAAPVPAATLAVSAPDAERAPGAPRFAMDPVLANFGGAVPEPHAWHVANGVSTTGVFEGNEYSTAANVLLPVAQTSLAIDGDAAAASPCVADDSSAANDSAAVRQSIASVTAALGVPMGSAPAHTLLTDRINVTGTNAAGALETGSASAVGQRLVRAGMTPGAAAAVTNGGAGLGVASGSVRLLPVAGLIFPPRAEEEASAAGEVAGETAEVFSAVAQGHLNPMLPLQRGTADLASALQTAVSTRATPALVGAEGAVGLRSVVAARPLRDQNPYAAAATAAAGAAVRMADDDNDAGAVKDEVGAFAHPLDRIPRPPLATPFSYSASIWVEITPKAMADGDAASASVTLSPAGVVSTSCADGAVASPSALAALVAEAARATSGANGRFDPSAAAATAATMSAVVPSGAGGVTELDTDTARADAERERAANVLMPHWDTLAGYMRALLPVSPALVHFVHEHAHLLQREIRAPLRPYFSLRSLRYDGKISRIGKRRLTNFTRALFAPPSLCTPVSFSAAAAAAGISSLLTAPHTFGAPVTTARVDFWGRFHAHLRARAAMARRERAIKRTELAALGLAPGASESGAATPGPAGVSMMDSPVESAELDTIKASVASTTSTGKPRGRQPAAAPVPTVTPVDRARAAMLAAGQRSLLPAASLLGAGSAVCPAQTPSLMPLLAVSSISQVYDTMRVALSTAAAAAATATEAAETTGTEAGAVPVPRSLETLDQVTGALLEACTFSTSKTALQTVSTAAQATLRAAPAAAETDETDDSAAAAAPGGSVLVPAASVKATASARMLSSTSVMTMPTALSVGLHLVGPAGSAALASGAASGSTDPYQISKSWGTVTPAMGLCNGVDDVVYSGTVWRERADSAAPVSASPTEGDDQLAAVPVATVVARAPFDPVSGNFASGTYDSVAAGRVRAVDDPVAPNGLDEVAPTSPVPAAFIFPQPVADAVARRTAAEAADAAAHKKVTKGAASAAVKREPGTETASAAASLQPALGDVSVTYAYVPPAKILPTATLASSNYSYITSQISVGTFTAAATAGAAALAQVAAVKAESNAAAATDTAASATEEGSAAAGQLLERAPLPTHPSALQTVNEPSRWVFPPMVYESTGGEEALAPVSANLLSGAPSAAVAGDDDAGDDDDTGVAAVAGAKPRLMGIFAEPTWSAVPWYVRAEDESTVGTDEADDAVKDIGGLGGGVRANTLPAPPKPSASSARAVADEEDDEEGEEEEDDEDSTRNRGRGGRPSTGSGTRGRTGNSSKRRGRGRGCGRGGFANRRDIIEDDGSEGEDGPEGSDPSAGIIALTGDALLDYVDGSSSTSDASRPVGTVGTPVKVKIEPPTSPLPNTTASRKLSMTTPAALSSSASASASSSSAGAGASASTAATSYSALLNFEPLAIATASRFDSALPVFKSLVPLGAGLQVPALPSVQPAPVQAPAAQSAGATFASATAAEGFVDAVLDTAHPTHLAAAAGVLTVTTERALAVARAREEAAATGAAPREDQVDDDLICLGGAARSVVHVMSSAQIPGEALTVVTAPFTAPVPQGGDAVSLATVPWASEVSGSTAAAAALSAAQSSLERSRAAGIEVSQAPNTILAPGAFAACAAGGSVSDARNGTLADAAVSALKAGGANTYGTAAGAVEVVYEPAPGFANVKPRWVAFARTSSGPNAGVRTSATASTAQLEVVEPEVKVEPTIKRERKPRTSVFPHVFSADEAATIVAALQSGAGDVPSALLPAPTSRFALTVPAPPLPLPAPEALHVYCPSIFPAVSAPGVAPGTTPSILAAATVAAASGPKSGLCGSLVDNATDVLSLANAHTRAYGAPNAPGTTAGTGGDAGVRALLTERAYSSTYVARARALVETAMRRILLTITPQPVTTEAARTALTVAMYAVESESAALEARWLGRVRAPAVDDTNDGDDSGEDEDEDPAVPTAAEDGVCYLPSLAHVCALMAPITHARRSGPMLPRALEALLSPRRLRWAAFAAAARTTAFNTRASVAASAALARGRARAETAVIAEKAAANPEGTLPSVSATASGCVSAVISHLVSSSVAAASAPAAAAALGANTSPLVTLAEGAAAVERMWQRQHSATAQIKRSPATVGPEDTKRARLATAMVDGSVGGAIALPASASQTVTTALSAASAVLGTANEPALWRDCVPAALRPVFGLGAAPANGDAREAAALIASLDPGPHGAPWRKTAFELLQRTVNAIETATAVSFEAVATGSGAVVSLESDASPAPGLEYVPGTVLQPVSVFQALARQTAGVAASQPAAIAGAVTGSGLVTDAVPLVAPGPHSVLQALRVKSLALRHPPSLHPLPPLAALHAFGPGYWWVHGPLPLGAAMQMAVAAGGAHGAALAGSVGSDAINARIGGLAGADVSFIKATFETALLRSFATQSGGRVEALSRLIRRRVRIAAAALATAFCARARIPSTHDIVEMCQRFKAKRYVLPFPAAGAATPGVSSLARAETLTSVGGRLVVEAEHDRVREVARVVSTLVEDSAVTPAGSATTSASISLGGGTVVDMVSCELMLLHRELNAQTLANNKARARALYNLLVGNIATTGMSEYSMGAATMSGNAAPALRSPPARMAAMQRQRRHEAAVLTAYAEYARAQQLQRQQQAHLTQLQQQHAQQLHRTHSVPLPESMAPPGSAPPAVASPPGTAPVPLSNVVVPPAPVLQRIQQNLSHALLSCMQTCSTAAASATAMNYGIESSDHAAQAAAAAAALRPGIGNAHAGPGLLQVQLMAMGVPLPPQIFGPGVDYTVESTASTAATAATAATGAASAVGDDEEETRAAAAAAGVPYVGGTTYCYRVRSTTPYVSAQQLFAASSVNSSAARAAALAQESNDPAKSKLIQQCWRALDAAITKVEARVHNDAARTAQRSAMRGGRGGARGGHMAARAGGQAAGAGAAGIEDAASFCICGSQGSGVQLVKVTDASVDVHDLLISEDGNHLLGCEGPCERWFHPRCVGLTIAAAECDLEVFYCQQCQRADPVNCQSRAYPPEVSAEKRREF